MTAIKFLVEEGSYKYILSGSLLGVHLKDLKGARSLAVGYMDYMQMYPLDFEEFIRANGISAKVIDSLRNNFETAKPVNAAIHNRMMELFRLYLLVGGMPAVVKKYLETKNLIGVYREQNMIISLLKMDISRVDLQNKLYLEEIFDRIPSELSSQNIRFIFKGLGPSFRLSRNENCFIWLRDAGVANPVFACDEPVAPLILSKATNKFKLFLADIGLLAAMYTQGFQLRILSGDPDINFGSIYENFAAQELKAHGFDLYYYNSSKKGEVDFLIEKDGEVLPIEIKSGKAYSRHRALTKLMNEGKPRYKKTYVFYNGTGKTCGDIQYSPIYNIMFLEKDDMPESLIYNLGII